MEPINVDLDTEDGLSTALAYACRLGFSHVGRKEALSGEQIYNQVTKEARCRPMHLRALRIAYSTGKRTAEILEAEKINDA